jgi:restriction system protein
MNRQAEVEELNDQIEKAIKLLNVILPSCLNKNHSIEFDTLRIKETFPTFSPPPELKDPAEAPSKDEYLVRVRNPNFMTKMIPGWSERYQKGLRRAEERFEGDLEEHVRSEQKREAKFNKLARQFQANREAFVKRTKEKDEEIDQLKNGYKSLDPGAVVTYNTMVLERSKYPPNFPRDFRLAYAKESKELIVDRELPTPGVVPIEKEWRYIKSKDEVEQKPRKPVECKELYQDVIASLALRTCHEVFAADQGKTIDVVVFNGSLRTLDPATGNNIRPCLISLRVTKERFQKIKLASIDKLVCLRNLGAQVSPRPSEIQAVKPIVEFDMIDKRFVDQTNILADLESRPNLMDLNPFEFEHLIANLFSQIGLETKLTQSSRDGGVDAVAFDMRPVIGGKVVIQAKRYKNTVGVSAVRDLYGTMLNEGANKGILVTTSGYGPDAFEFAKDKPIELIAGGQLLFLLEQVGVKARIIFPEDIKPPTILG